MVMAGILLFWNDLINMSSYGLFAQYYNELTENIDYKARATYFSDLIKKYGNGGTSLLDLACGTGTLSFALSDLGYQVIGADRSEEMLTQAMMKNSEGLLFVHQDMENLQLYEPVDTVICALDSLNHVSSIVRVEKIFKRVSSSLNDGGLFIFDVNSRYKHEKILANNTFLYDLDDVYCVWQNTWNKDESKTQIDLDFFVNTKENQYERYEEHFAEYVYDFEELKPLLEKVGLEILQVYADDTFISPNEGSERFIYVTKKQKETSMKGEK